MRTAPDLRVHLVTDAGLCESAGRTVRETVITAVEGGATRIQSRAKGSDGRLFPEGVLEVAEAIGEKVPVITSDRVDVFLAARTLGAQAAGMHVGQSDLPAFLVRTLIGEDVYPGLLIDTQEGTQAAREEGAADHVGFSALHTTATKTDTPDVLGFEGCKRLKRIVGTPAVAIGGVGVDDMAQLARIGIDEGAIVPTICCAPDPAATAAQLLAQRNEGAQG